MMLPGGSKEEEIFIFGLHQILRKIIFYQIELLPVPAFFIKIQYFS